MFYVHSYLILLQQSPEIVTNLPVALSHLCSLKNSAAQIYSVLLILLAMYATKEILFLVEKFSEFKFLNKTNLQMFVEIIMYGSHWRWKSTRWTQRYVDLWNNLGFSLYAVPSVYCIVMISENRKKSEMEMSTNLVCCCWTLEIEFNKNLSLSIIRLANYSVTTSLIYEFLL